MEKHSNSVKAKPKEALINSKTTSQIKPKNNFTDFNNQPFPIKNASLTNATNVNKAKSTYEEVKDVIVKTVKKNKLTHGTQQMMDNERIHAEEAIQSGIYITWSSGDSVDCFRVGSNSMCICSHGFAEHEKILNKKKQSSKCSLCKCKAFTYIPVFPEEIGEYWHVHRNNFDYTMWKANCKCKHPWKDHSVDKLLSCMKCGCFKFNSNFCCAVCDKFWQDHEMIWELEHERYMCNKPIAQDFLPFREMPGLFDALYNK
jgi:hypothetical protein